MTIVCTLQNAYALCLPMKKIIKILLRLDERNLCAENNTVQFLYRSVFYVCFYDNYLNLSSINTTVFNNFVCSIINLTPRTSRL